MEAITADGNTIYAGLAIQSKFTILKLDFSTIGVSNPKMWALDIESADASANINISYFPTDL